MNMKNLFCVLLSIVALQPLLADAAETFTLDPVIISARGRASSVKLNPGGTAVVESEAISEGTKISVADVLSSVPGITVSGDSLWGRDVSIRGLSGTSVIVLIDGKRINTSTDINARLGLINTKDIERVEVLKGPVSSLYGSGSTGGIINIITRKGSFTKEPEFQGRLSQSLSSNPSGYDGYANLNHSSDNFWLSGSAGYRNFDDYQAGGSHDIPNSSFTDRQGRVAAGLKATPDLTLEMQFMRLEAADVGIPGGPSTLPRAARVRYPRTAQTIASLDANLKTGTSFLRELQAALYYNTIERRVLVDEIGPLSPISMILPEADHQTHGGKVQGLFQAGDHALVCGLDAWSWGIESKRSRFLKNGNVLIDAAVPKSRQTSIGFFAEDDWKISSDWTINTGVRADFITTSNKAGNGFPESNRENFGWNVHAGLTWQMNPQWSQSLLLASSYRAADILERFKLIDLGGGQVVRGNPGLDTEKSLFAEYGLHYRSSLFRGDLRTFYNNILDYVVEQRVSPTVLVMSNVGRALLYGAELEGRLRFADDWTMFASVAAIVGRDEIKKEPLPKIPPVSGKIGLEYAVAGWWARVESLWAAAQSETPAGVAGTSGYALLNAGAGHMFKTGRIQHETSLLLNNIFNARHRNHLANSRGIVLYEPGFSAMLTHTISF